MNPQVDTVAANVVRFSVRRQMPGIFFYALHRALQDSLPCRGGRTGVPCQTHASSAGDARHEIIYNDL